MNCAGCESRRWVALSSGMQVEVVCGQPGKVAEGEVLCADHFPKVIE